MEAYGKGAKYPHGSVFAQVGHQLILPALPPAPYLSTPMWVRVEVSDGSPCPSCQTGGPKAMGAWELPSWNAPMHHIVQVLASLVNMLGMVQANAASCVCIGRPRSDISVEYARVYLL